MGGLRPLRAALFIYECVRILLLIVLLFIVPEESGFSGSFPGAGGFLSGSYESGAFFPYLVYLSANALFPLMALFVWLRPEEYRNYLTLYMAGKIITAVSFYAWGLFSTRNLPGMENLIRSIALLGGSIFICLADILSVGGAWALKRKYRQELPAA